MVIDAHRSAHVLNAVSLVALLWRLIVWGPSISPRSAVQMTSNANFFALFKPTGGLSLGSQSSQILKFGWESRSSPIRRRFSSVTVCSSCDEASSALFTASMEGRKMRTLQNILLFVCLGNSAVTGGVALPPPPSSLEPLQTRIHRVWFIGHIFLAVTVSQVL